MRWVWSVGCSVGWSGRSTVGWSGCGVGCGVLGVVLGGVGVECWVERV